MSKKEKTIFLCISLGLLVYLCLKAFYVPLIHDEVATFYYYVQTKNFLPFYAHLYANNHILNSALTAFFYSLFGSSEFVLRMASLLSFIVYIFYTYKISEEINSKIVKWTFIILLLFTHNFIEFFTLCRGYAMSAALLLGSIYHLIQVLKNPKLIVHCSLSLLFGFLALSANLTLLPTFLIIISLLVLNYVLNIKSYKRYSTFKLLIVHCSLFIVLGLAPAYYFILYLLKLKKAGLLDVGSLNGFWDTTIKSISVFLTGYHNLAFPYFFIIIFIISLFIFILLYLTPKSKVSSTKLYVPASILNSQFSILNSQVFFILLIGNIASIIILAKLFKVNYPEDRTGYYLYPLFIGSICFLADKFITLTNKKLILLSFVPLIFFPLHFFANINLNHFALYHDVYGETEIPKRFFCKLCSEPKQGEFPQTIGGYQLQYLCWEYYNYRKDGNMGVLNYLNYPDSDEDYQVVNLKQWNLPGWKQYYNRIDYDKVSDYTLLKRKKIQERILVSGSSKDTKSNVDEFYELHSMPADSLRGKVLYVGYKLTINAAAIPFPAWIVIEVRNKEGKSLIYEYICLNWLKLKYDGHENNFINGAVIHKIPKDAVQLITYLWNIDKNPVSLKGNCYVYTLKE